MYRRDFIKHPVWNKGKKGLQVAWNKGLPREQQPCFGKIMTVETRRKIGKRLIGRIISEEHRQKISLKNKGRKHTKEAIENIRAHNVKYWLGKHLSTSAKEKISQARMKQVLPLKDTKIELKMQEELKRRGISFKKHIEIFGLPDIFVEPNICIFCDGDYWHNREGAKERDAKVNDRLGRIGYRVVRFWEHEINKSPEECIKRVFSYA